MAFNEGGMASGLLIIAVSIVFAAGFGFLVLHFVPGTKCKTKKPKPAAKTIDTAMIRRPDAIPPSLNAI